MKKDEIYMKRAIKNALKAKGRTGPNPLVGAVIVKGGRIISEGFHKGPGENHAEIAAINSAVENLTESTLYVTLEPCNQWGRTPPCVETIEEIKFKRIVIGMKDPNPKVCGKSIARLKRKGYDVECGILEDETAKLNPYFEHFIKNKKTYFIVKIAQTIDGFIASEGKKKEYITSSESLKFVHKIRFDVDAILVGSNTINIDNPILDTRFIKKSYKPSIIILDFSNKLDYTKNIIKDSSRKKYIFISKKFASSVKRRDDIEYLFTKKKEDSWKILRNDFQERNVISIMIEGGIAVFADAFKNRVCDELIVFTAPVVKGRGKRIPLSEKPSDMKMVISEIKKLNDDIMVRYKCSQD